MPKDLVDHPIEERNCSGFAVYSREQMSNDCHRCITFSNFSRYLPHSMESNNFLPPEKSTLNTRVADAKDSTWPPAKSAASHDHSGTRTAIIHGTDFQSKTLDTILSGAHPDLIKSDVDGFDYDVIASAAMTIATSSPILFFEYNCIKPEQIKPYSETVLELEAKGYRFAAFDNFGLPMLQNVEANVIIQLTDYVQHQNEGRSRRTIYYLDNTRLNGAGPSSH
jgi:Methyltransferase FkbM domain